MAERNGALESDGRDVFPEVVVIIIRRADGRLFVHQRRGDKETFPLRFGLGAGGRMEPAESPGEAAVRELQEETGLSAPLRRLFDLEYRDEQIERQLHVFEATVPASGEVSWDHGEWEWCGWLTAEELAQLRASGQLCPDTAALYDRYRAAQ